MDSEPGAIIPRPNTEDTVLPAERMITPLTPVGHGLYTVPLNIKGNVHLACVSNTAITYIPE